jgi:hypothetical protein
MREKGALFGAGPKPISKEGLAEAYAIGVTEALIKAFPELQAIFDMFAEGNIAAAKMAYLSSPYFQNLTDVGKKRQTKKKLQPGVYAQEFDQWFQAQKVRLAGKGIKYTDSMKSILEASFDAGDSDLQLDIKILDSGLFGSIGGSTLGSINSLKDYAVSQGVNNLLPKDYWDKIQTSLFAGTLTREDVEEEIKNFAISAYPAYAKGILEGKSFSLQTSALRQQTANLLERDVDTITDNDPIFKQVLQYRNPQTGALEIMPLWQAEQVVKSTDEWLYTKNAMSTFDTLGLKVLQDWGLL